MELPENLIETDEFQEAEYLVVFKNDTSGTKMFDPNMTVIGEFITGETDGIVLQVPLNSCQVKHNLILYFFDGPLETDQLKQIVKGNLKGGHEFLGKVVALEKDDQNKESKNVFITLEFSQFDEEYWRKIIDRIEELQKAIMGVLNKTVG